MIRRSFLHRAGGVVLGLFGLGNRQARASQGRATTLTILHTNVLAANLIERKGSKPFAKPYIIKQVSGVSVGILGLAYPKTACEITTCNGRRSDESASLAWICTACSPRSIAC